MEMKVRQKRKPEVQELKNLLRGQYRVVNVDDVEPNPWNPNHQSEFMYDREKRSILEFGFVDDVIVRSGNEDGPLKSLQIIDGEHRHKAMRDLGHKSISVKDLGTVPDLKAKALTQMLNRLHGEDDKQKRADLINDILVLQPDYIDILPYTEVELDHIKSMSEFDWDSLSGDSPTREGEEDQAKIDTDFVKSLTCPHCGKSIKLEK